MPPEVKGLANHSRFYSQFTPGLAPSTQSLSIPLTHSSVSRKRWFDSEIGSLYHALSHSVSFAVFGIFELTTIRQ